MDSEAGTVCDGAFCTPMQRAPPPLRYTVYLRIKQRKLNHIHNERPPTSSRGSGGERADKFESSTSTLQMR